MSSLPVLQLNLLQVWTAKQLLLMQMKRRQMKLDFFFHLLPKAQLLWVMNQQTRTVWHAIATALATGSIAVVSSRDLALNENQVKRRRKIIISGDFFANAAKSIKIKDRDIDVLLLGTFWSTCLNVSAIY